MGLAPVGRRYIVENDKGERLEKLQRELVVVDVGKLEAFKPLKKGKRGTEFKSVRSQLLKEAEMARGGIDQGNVLTKPRRNPRARAVQTAKKVSFDQPREKKVAPQKAPKKAVPYKKGQHVSVYFPQYKKSYQGIVRGLNKRSVRVFYPADGTESLVHAPYSLMKALVR